MMKSNTEFINTSNNDNAPSRVKYTISIEANDFETNRDDVNSLEANDNAQKVPILTKHRNILESLEAKNIEIHSHCRDGFCGVCRVTLISGEIHYPNGEPLAYVGDNEILPCCCIAKSNLVLKLD